MMDPENGGGGGGGEEEGSSMRKEQRWILTTFSKKQRCPAQRLPSNRRANQYPEVQVWKSPCPEFQGPESPGLRSFHTEPRSHTVCGQMDPSPMRTNAATIHGISDASIDMQYEISDRPTDAFSEIEVIGSRRHRIGYSSTNFSRKQRKHPPSNRRANQYPAVQYWKSPYPKIKRPKLPALGSFYTEPASNTVYRQMDPSTVQTFHRFSGAFTDMQHDISEQPTGAFGETKFVSRGRRDNSWTPAGLMKRQHSTEHPLSNRGANQYPQEQEFQGPESPGLRLFRTEPRSPMPKMITEAATFHLISGAFTEMQYDISEQPTDAFGEIEFVGSRGRRSNFLRLSCDTDPKKAYKLITGLWKLPSPNLVLSLVEGEGRDEIKTWVRDFLRDGLVRAAQSTGAWILTDGLRRGVARCVGEAVRNCRAAAPALSQKVIAVGVAPWGMVYNRQQLVNPEGSYPAQYHVTKTSGDSFCLDNNHQAFLLVDDGSEGRWGGERSFRTNLEDHISKQRTNIQGRGSTEIPVLYMLISGDSSMLKRVDSSLRKETPWLVLAGSGPAANLLTDISSDPYLYSGAEDLGLPNRVSERLKRHFPLEHVDHLLDSALNICHHRDLITVFHGEEDSSEDFQTVLLNALMKAKEGGLRETSDYTVALKQAVAWNNVSIARSELQNEDIQWKTKDLEDLMTDALIKNNLQFVRLFCENGLNIQEYLTYGRLEELYSSLSQSLPAYKRPSKHKRKAGPTSETSQQRRHSPDKITLSEVSCMLWNLTGEVCQLFYNHAGTRQMCRKETPCPSPWSALFIWAVLVNRDEMAMYFWERAEESVLSALGGCKLFRERSKWEFETEKQLAMEELAQKFENLAREVFGECYQNSECRSYILLIRKSPVWGGATCLEMAAAANARLFFSHDGVQSLLSRIWWGDMEKDTEVWRFLLTFFVPPLIYTDLITFREDEEEEKELSKGDVRDCEVIEGSYKSRIPLSTISEKSQEECGALNKDVEDPSPPKRNKSFLVSRWKQFWFVPVTSFLGNVLMYFLFLCLFASILLVDFKPPPPGGPSISEYVLYFWVFTFMCEEIRQMFGDDDKSMTWRIKIYIKDDWNKFDLTAISLFLLALCCRMFHRSYEVGRAMMALDFVVFTIRLLHIFSIHRVLGPKIIMVRRMMKDLIFFLFFLAVWLVAYGVANKALLYSYDTSPIQILNQVFYQPYMFIFGQLPEINIDADVQETDKCTYNPAMIKDGQKPCLSTNWLVIVLFIIYLLFANIVLVNLLIAMFSYTFNEVQEHSDIHWKYLRYKLIMEYYSKPYLAPPFIIFSHLQLFIKRFVKGIPSVHRHCLALELEKKKASQLYRWEATQKEILISPQKKRQRESDSDQLRSTLVRVDSMLKQMEEIRDQNRRLKSEMVSLLAQHSSVCCSTLSEITDALCLSGLMPPQTNSSHEHI